MGYFGMLANPNGGGSTELSSAFTLGGRFGRQDVEHPLMVPTLTAEELKHLLSGAEPTPEIYDKAESHARYRMSQGQSPFAGPTDLRYPRPK